MKKSILRIVSMVLSIALLTGCLNVGVFASNGGTITFSGSAPAGKTDAQLVADYAGSYLSDGEKAVLHCTALVGNEHIVTAPTDSDKNDLIIINKEAKTVEVKNYPDGAYTWKPAKVQLVYGDNQTADITLDANGVGSFSCDSNTYSIEVTYVVETPIEGSLFQTLLKAPMYLANGIINMNAVAALAGDMKSLAAYTDTLYSLTKTGGGLIEKDLEKAIIALRNDAIANSTATEKKFKINTLIEAYNAAENKTQYMIENGAEFKATFETYLANLTVCAYDSQWDSAISVAKMMADTCEANGLAELAADYRAKAALLETAVGLIKGWGDSAAAIDSSNWEFVNHTIVKSTATTAEWSALNDAVLELAEGGKITHDVNLVEMAKYTIASTTLKQGVDQFNVTVKVQANVINGKDSNALTPVASAKTVTVTLDKGAAKADVIAAIKATGVLDDAIAAWAADEATKNFDINETNYAIVGYVGLGDTLTSDVVCTVTLEPVKYDLDFCGNVTEVYYGYVKTLTTYAIENGDGSKSYDYKVNGVSMREGLTYRVTSDTVITRTEGKATEAYLIREVVANSYKPGNSLTADAKSVLYSTAINSDSIYYRTPANLELVEVKTVAEATYKVVADLLYSGLPSGAYWMPVGGYLLNGSTKIEGVSLNFYNTETNCVADVTYAGDDFTEVKVEYQLVIADSDVDGLTDTYVNLPHTLVEEAKAQKAILGSLSGSVYTNLSSIDGQMANILFTLIAGNTNNLSAETKAAASQLQAECLDVNGHFYILDHIAGYKTNGLAYLYTGDNSAKVKAEIETLRTYMLVIVEDPNLPDFIRTNISLMPGANADEYIEKLDGIGVDLKALNLESLNVNSWINTEAGLAVLKDLVSAIDAATGDTQGFGKGNKLVLSETLSAPASDNLKKLVVNVSAYNSTGSLIGGTVHTGNLTFVVGNSLTSDDINKINTLISELEGKLGIDKSLYNPNSFKLPAVGDTFAGTTTIDITYTPKSYTVNVAGEAQTIYSDNTTVVLPPCTTTGSKYVYAVPGRADIIVTNEAAQITFSADELKTLFTNDTLNITRTEVVLAREDIIAFADAMNKAFNSAGLNISFAALENAEGKVVLVLNVDAAVLKAGQDALMGAVSNMATALANSAYVGLGGHDFWDVSTLSISIQSLIDMIAESDFGLGKLASIIDANGKVVPVALNGYTLIGGGYAAGAELITTTLAHNAPSNVYDLYITFGGDAATLKELDGTLEGIAPYADVQCGNGMFNVTINAPEAVRAIYIMQMVMTGRADLYDVTNTNTGDNLAYEISLIRDLFADPNFTPAVIEATAAKLGQKLDLSSIESNFETIRKVVNYLLDLELEGEGTYYEGSISITLRDKLISMGINDKLLDFVKEAGADSEGLVVDFSIKVNGLEEKYEALVFDYSAAGMLDKFYVTKDLDKVLSKLGNNAVVVLLSDVIFDDTVVINNNVFINLNGKTINGNMTANGTVRIVDSLASTECGSVNGNLAGNFVLTGGKYSCDVSSMLPNGYEVTETGFVSNKLYTVVEENGNITINLTADFFNRDLYPDITTNIKDTAALLNTPVLADVAFDIALNMFTKAQMFLNGEEVYNIVLCDAMSYLSGASSAADLLDADMINTALDFINWEALTSFISTVATDLCDFAALKTAVETGAPVASYSYEAKAWEISPVRVENGYITLDLIASAEYVKTGAISVVITGTEDEKAELAELCDGLASTVTVNNIEISVTDVIYKSMKEIEVEYDAAIDVEIDFSGDYNYAALIGTAVAYAMPSGNAKTNLVKALDAYFTNNSDAKALADALDNVTAAQLIAAIKALSSTTCEAMLTKLGLKSAEVVELEAVYSDLIDIAGVVLAKLDITGPASKLSAIKVAGESYKYAFVSENAKGYNVDVAIAITLFGKISEATDIVIETPVIDLGVSSDIVAGWEVDGDIIFVDIAPEGWSVEDVTHVIFNAPGADKIEVSVLDRNNVVKATGLICNGDKIKVVATNAKGSAEAEYVVIVMGDTNSDGITNIGDAYAIAQYYTGSKTFDTVDILAADLNGDGKINVGDTYKIAIKYTSWDDNSYESDLENK